MPSKISLSEDLEGAVLNALIRGLAPADVVKPEELSKPGRSVLAALEHLRQRGEPPYEINAVFITAVDILGEDREPLRAYLKRVLAASAGRETGELLRAVRGKQALIDLQNEIGAQLSAGALNPGALASKLQIDAEIGTLTPASEALKDGIPDAPTGVELVSLPTISKAAGGMFGMWAIASEPGVGKTTLAMQIAAQVGKAMSVLYYDYENGPRTLLHRLGVALNKDMDKIRQATERLYFRESIHTLESDLVIIKAPALIVVDSVQKLPTLVNHRRTGLDQWVHKLEALKKRGYTVLLVSEKGRGAYGQATLSGFKETSEIEYSADFGAQLVGDETDEHAPVEFHVVKNRHYPTRGHTCDLVRVNGWWYREAGRVEGDEARE